MKSAASIALAVLLVYYGCGDSTLAPEPSNESAISMEPVDKRVGRPGADSDPAPLDELSKRLGESPHGGSWLSVELSGLNEVGDGDPDGSGIAFFTLNQGKEEVCFELAVFDIQPATSAHIHEAPVGVNGGVVIALAPPTEGASKGCAYFVDRDLIKQIRKNPENYYVNVHNAEFPAGAVRGQLTR
jgi:hypothetical protein